MQTVYTILWYFILYAFIGWCLEVMYCSVETGKYVNRGFLNGPLCPIYGFGGLLIVGLLRPVEDNLLLLYLGSVLLTSLLELVGGFVLEKLFHTRWWDYSDMPFNLGGYICLKFSLLWGIAGVVMLRVLQPLLDALVGAIPTVLGLVLLALLYAALLADVVVTVLTVHKTNRQLRELEEISQKLRAESEKMAQVLGGTAIKAADRKEQLGQALQEKHEETQKALQKRRDELLARKNRMQQRLFHAFPAMRSLNNPEQLEAMKGTKAGDRGRH